MVDRLSRAERSAQMRRVRSTNTTPELAVRRLLHRAGYRYRLHRRDLPGTPDLVFAARRKVVFVHGCFWHRHAGCARGTSTPADNAAFWARKFAENTARDARQQQALNDAGWGVLVVWACELRDAEALLQRLVRFLGAPTAEPMTTEAPAPEQRVRIPGEASPRGRRGACRRTPA